MMKFSSKSYVLEGESKTLREMLIYRMDTFYNNTKNIEFINSLHDLAKKMKVKLVKLSTICGISSGRTPTDRMISKTEEYSIPLYRTSNIHKGKISLDDKTMYISSKDLGESTMVQKGDCLMTIVGATNEIVGRVALIEDNLIGSLNQNIARITACNEKLLLSKYLMIYLNSHLAQKQIERISKQGNQVNLNANQVGEILIILPEIDTQKKIIAEYEDNDKKIINCRQIINNFESQIDSCMFKGLSINKNLKKDYKSSIILNSIDSLRWDYNYYYFEKDFYIKQLKETVKNKEYQLIALKELVCDIFRGDSPKKYCEKGIPILQVNNIDPFVINYDKTKYISEDEYKSKPRFQLDENDLLITGIGPPLGEVCMVKKADIPIAAYNHITVLKINNEIVKPLFVMAFLNSIFGKVQISKYIFGVRQKYLTNEWIKEILVPVFPLQKQEEICNDVISELDKINKASKILSDIELTTFDEIISKFLTYDWEEE